MADMKAIMQQLSMQECQVAEFTKTVFGKHSYQERGRL